MQLFNVGALEFVFILLLAFIILGPEKAIKAAGDVARWVRNLTKSPFWRDLVSTSKEIQNLPKRLLEEDELQRTFDDLDRATGEINTIFKEKERKIGERSEPGDDDSVKN